MEEMQLFEMFPNKRSAIMDCISNGLTMNSVIDCVLQSNEFSMDTEKSFAQEIQEHALKYFDLNTYHYIKTTRSCMFNSGLCFYKHAMAKP